jgi:hypothetical protein
MDTQEQHSSKVVGRIQYSELGIPVSQVNGSRKEEYLLRVYDQMLTTAETNFFRRPIIQSFDSLGRKLSWLAIPTLEDLKYALFEADGSIMDLGSEKVFTMQDIETIAYLSDYSSQLKFMSALASNVMKIVPNTIDNFKKECFSSGGTAKILDVNRDSELSLDEFFNKYYEGVR